MDSYNQLAPTRRLTSKERKVFDRVASEFTHLEPSDSEQLSQYAEAVIRYQIAAKETKRHPTVSLPVVNRTTGNVTSSKTVRNPAFLNLREASAQMVSLGRRLLIDAHSAEKRLRLKSKLARSLSGIEASKLAENEALESVTEEQIQAVIDESRKGFLGLNPAQLRAFAIWVLTDPILNMPEDDPDIAYLYA